MFDESSCTSICDFVPENSIGEPFCTSTDKDISSLSFHDAFKFENTLSEKSIEEPSAASVDVRSSFQNADNNIDETDIISFIVNSSANDLLFDPSEISCQDVIKTSYHFIITMIYYTCKKLSIKIIFFFSECFHKISKTTTKNHPK